MDLVSRSAWGARTNRVGSRSIGRQSVSFGHHTYIPDVPWSAGESLSNQLADERRAVRGIESYHAKMGWSAAPGYNFIIGDTGRIYVCAGWGRRGVHTQQYNSRSYAFCWLINGQRRMPPERAIQAAVDLLAWGQRAGYLTEGFDLYPHEWAASKVGNPKDCPGRPYGHRALVQVREGRPGTGTDTGDWLDMATEQEVRDVVADVIKSNVTRAVIREELDRQRGMWGPQHHDQHRHLHEVRDLVQRVLVQQGVAQEDIDAILEAVGEPAEAEAT